MTTACLSYFLVDVKLTYYHDLFRSRQTAERQISGTSLNPKTVVYKTGLSTKKWRTEPMTKSNVEMVERMVLKDMEITRKSG